MVRTTKQPSINTDFALCMQGEDPVYLSNATLIQARGWAWNMLFRRYLETKEGGLVPMVHIVRFSKGAISRTVGRVYELHPHDDTAMWRNESTGKIFAINSAGGKAKN